MGTYRKWQAYRQWGNQRFEHRPTKPMSTTNTFQNKISTKRQGILYELPF